MITQAFTREAILAMPTGRALDALVAEHIFGHWHMPTDPIDYGWQACCGGPYGARFELPGYSVDMKSAMLVIDYWLERFSWTSLPDCMDRIEMTCWPKRDHRQPARCVIYYQDKEHMVDKVPLPEAVCKAALCAMMHE